MKLRTKHSVAFLVFLSALRGPSLLLHPLAAQMNPAAAISRALVQPPVLVWRAYLGHLERNPRTTKSFTSVVAAFAGDALAQHISNRDKTQWE